MGEIPRFPVKPFFTTSVRGWRLKSRLSAISPVAENQKHVFKRHVVSCLTGNWGYWEGIVLVLGKGGSRLTTNPEITTSSGRTILYDITLVPPNELTGPADHAFQLWTTSKCKKLPGNICDIKKGDSQNVLLMKQPSPTSKWVRNKRWKSGNVNSSPKAILSLYP